MKNYLVLSLIVTASMVMINAQPPNGPASCDPGTYYDSSKFFCEVCKRGSYCPGGTPASNAVSNDCPTGWYSNFGATSCTPCPAGTFAYSFVKGGLEVCRLCPAGTYQPYTNVSSSGSGWNDVVFARGAADDTCIKCPYGTYSSTPGAAACTGLIPVGIMHIYADSNYKYIGDTSPLGYLNLNQTCFDGWNCGLGPENRYKCRKGSYANKNTNGLCEVCPMGSYSDTVGASSCKSCGTGYSTTTNSSTGNDCLVCPSNTIALDTTYYTANLYNLPARTTFNTINDCGTNCPGGYGIKPSMNTQCEGCFNINKASVQLYYAPDKPLGFFGDLSNFNSTCQDFCPPGTYLYAQASSVLSFCDICTGNGKYCPGGAINIANNLPAQQDCGTGKTSTWGAKSLADCIPLCPNANECYHDNSNVCEVRKGGYHYDSFTTRCTPCDVKFGKGYGTSVTPAVGDTCTQAPRGKGWLTNTTFGDCPAGHYCPQETFSIAKYVPPIPCPPNTQVFTGFSPRYGAKTICEPLTCPAGTSFDDGEVACLTNKCWSTEVNSYIRSCPGGNVAANEATAEMCTEMGEVVSSNGTMCVTDSCKPGYYLYSQTYLDAPINGTRCRPCPNTNHLYCPGGTSPPQICHPNATVNTQKGIVAANRTMCFCSNGVIGKSASGCIAQNNNNNNNQNGGCTGMPPPCQAPMIPACMGSSWSCIQYTPPTCTGDESVCNGRVTCTTNNAPFTCTAFPSCLPGEYIERYIPTVDTVCHSPPTGTTTCAAGTYLTVSGSNAASAVFTCSPCPSGYTCSGGIGALALSITETSAPFTSNPCTSAEIPIFTEIQPGVYPLEPLKVKCAKRYSIPTDMQTAVLSCSPGSVVAGLWNMGCQPCPVGAANCQGGFHPLTRTSNNNNNVAASASPTPSNTPSPSSSASSAPPAQQDILVPYLISSPEVCASTAVADKFLDPSTGIAINLRYSMATSLGYNGSAAFVSGLVLCDNTYIPVDKNAAINKANADQLFNTTNNNNNRRRRLYDMLNSLSLPIDGTTVVVELGVSVPSILAPALTNLMVAMITNQSTADIQALAANLTAIMASPEYVAMYPAQSGPNTATGLPPSLTAVINTAANAGNVPSFTASLGTVINAAIIPLFDALNITLSNFTASLFSSGVRSGQIITYTNNNNGNNGGVTTPSESSGNSSNNSALGALVLIPIAGLVVWFIIWYRRRKEEKDKSAGKSLDDNFTDVTTSNTSTDKKFEVANPSTNLMIRRTVVEVKSNANSSTSAV